MSNEHAIAQNVRIPGAPASESESVTQLLVEM